MTWNVLNMLQGITAQVRAARGGAAVGRHPYHLGPLSNAAAVMGPVGPAWCLPLVRGSGCGGALLTSVLTLHQPGCIGVVERRVQLPAVWSGLLTATLWRSADGRRRWSWHGIPHNMGQRAPGAGVTSQTLILSGISSGGIPHCLVAAVLAQREQTLGEQREQTAHAVRRFM